LWPDAVGIECEIELGDMGGADCVALLVCIRRDEELGKAKRENFL